MKRTNDSGRISFPILAMANEYGKSKDEVSVFIHKILMATASLKIKYQKMTPEDVLSSVYLCFDFHCFLFANKGLSKNPEIASLMILPMMVFMGNHEDIFGDGAFDYYAEEVLPVSTMAHGAIIGFGKAESYIQNDLFEQWSDLIDGLEFTDYVNALDKVKEASTEYTNAALADSLQTHRKLNSLLD